MPSHSVVCKAHAWLLLSKYSRDQLSYDEVAFITGPSGMYPFSEREMSRQTLDRLVERAGQTGDPGWRKPRVDENTLGPQQHRELVSYLGVRSTRSTAWMIEQLKIKFPGRSKQAESTVNDSLVALGFSAKKVTRLNPLRDALLSARYHVLAATIAFKTLINIDCSHMAKTALVRRSALPTSSALLLLARPTERCRLRLRGCVSGPRLRPLAQR